ncbi:MAG TPA: hypothetical protein VEP90_05735, partial [Methylomirabilota bacterium]|nr:hypothetical protein [Methylomirabilota bacterium]
TIMEKLRSEKEILQDQISILSKQVDTSDARIEEVRLLLYKKDEALQKKIEEFIYLEMRNEKLEEVIKDLLEKKKHGTTKEWFKRFFRL